MTVSDQSLQCDGTQRSRMFTPLGSSRSCCSRCWSAPRTTSSAPTSWWLSATCPSASPTSSSHGRRTSTPGQSERPTFAPDESQSSIDLDLFQAKADLSTAVPVSVVQCICRVSMICIKRGVSTHLRQMRPQHLVYTPSGALALNTSASATSSVPPLKYVVLFVIFIRHSSDN